jgi:hypothetical protein
MSNSRKYRRSMEPARGRKVSDGPAMSDEELAALTRSWNELTDEVIEMIATNGQADADMEQWLHRKLDELSELYGGGAMAVGAVGSCTTLASHILMHEPVVGDVAGAIETADWLDTPKETRAAERLAAAILAAAAGMPGSEVACLIELFEKPSADALGAALGVWMIFCALGTAVGVGIDFCDAERDDLDDTDLDDTERDDAEREDAERDGIGSERLPADPERLVAGAADIEVLLETALEATGLAAGLIAALASGEDNNALALARSVSAFGAEEETAVCLGLLGVIEESSASALRAVGEAIQQVLDAVDGHDFEERGDETIGAALVSLASDALAADPQRPTAQVIADIERRVALVRAASR